MRPALFVVAALALSACSVSFDPAGQPCDATGACLAGYTCDATKHCQSISGGSSGSTGSSGSACGGHVCAAEQRCATDGGASSCVDRTGSGVLCSTDTECAPGACLKSPGAALGLCASACSPGADAGCPAGLRCTALTGARGNRFNACLQAPAPQVCGRDADCGGTLRCLPFDSASSTLGEDLPVLFCDRGVADGGASGAACAGDAQCAGGVCAAVGTGYECLTACAGSGCGTGQSCTAVREFDHAHILLACVATNTAASCSPCGPCGPDAPDCDSATNTCVLTCDPLVTNACGGTRTCLSNAQGSPFCAVDGGRCP